MRFFFVAIFAALCIWVSTEAFSVDDLLPRGDETCHPYWGRCEDKKPCCDDCYYCACSIYINGEVCRCNEKHTSCSKK
nr:venom gland protein U9-PHTX-Pmx1a [Physocyclus mexicanus]